MKFSSQLKLLLLAIGLIVLVEAPCAVAETGTLTFRNDVMPVLSKAGCNAGSCHGNANGKGGFRLSLRGQDPDLDWMALTHEQGGRRVNLQDAEHSLVMLKATG